MNIDKLKDEFAGKTNHEAYELAFTKRLMRPDPNTAGAFLGNTQRQEFIPHLRKLLQELPAQSQIFDIGAGSGEIIETALKDLKGATLNILEPNPVLLGQYQKRLAMYPSLTAGISYCGLLEDYYPSVALAQNPQGADKSPPKKPDQWQHLILAIHMLYHATDPHGESFNPDSDIEKAISAMYSFLAPGGSIFVVIANQIVSTTGQVGRYYFSRTGQPEIAKRLLQIAESRKRLLMEGGIIPLINTRFPDGEADLHCVTSDSCIYGDSQEDLVAMCITAEIGVIDDAPFDLNKLDICAEFFRDHSEAIGLAVEDGDLPQKGMIRSNQPQLITTIRRIA